MSRTSATTAPPSAPSASHLRRPRRRRLATTGPEAARSPRSISSGPSGIGRVILLDEARAAAREGVPWPSVPEAGDGVKGSWISPERDGPLGNSERIRLRASCGEARISDSAFSRSSAISPAV